MCPGFVTGVARLALAGEGGAPTAEAGAAGVWQDARIPLIYSNIYIGNTDREYKYIYIHINRYIHLYILININ